MPSARVRRDWGRQQFGPSAAYAGCRSSITAAYAG